MPGKERSNRTPWDDKRELTHIQDPDIAPARLTAEIIDYIRYAKEKGCNDRTKDMEMNNIETVEE